MTTNSSSLFQRLERKYGRLTFGDLLKSLREGEGLSQTAFAKRLGLSVQNLCDLEKGRRIPSATRATKIAKKLHLPEIPMIRLAIRDSLFSQGLEIEVILRKIA